MVDELEQNVEQPTPSPPEDPAVDLGIGPEPQKESFDDYDNWVEARINYQTRKATAELRQEQAARAKAESDAGLALLKESVKAGAAEGFREVVTPQPPAWAPDDEHRTERQKAIQWRAQHLDEAEVAARGGDYKKAMAERERAEYLVKDLQAKGPTEAERLAPEIKYRERLAGIVKLGELPLNDDPAWRHPRMIHDTLVLTNEHNQDPKATMLVLPTWDPESGKMRPIKPSNMQMAELPDDVRDRVVRNVYHYRQPNDTPETLLKKLHDAIVASGHRSSLHGTILYPEQERAKKKEPEATIENSQKAFEAWRAKNQARKY